MADNKKNQKNSEKPDLSEFYEAGKYPSDLIRREYKIKDRIKEKN